VVAGIVVWVSLQLGRRTVTALLDGVPASLRDEIVKAIQMPGVEEVQQVRVRQSGPETFVDIALTVQRDIALERAHDIASRAEEAIRSRVPGADVVVHIEPIRSSREDLQTTIRVLAAHQGLSAHGIRIYNLGPSGRAIELHLEVSDTLSVEEAHAQATAFEQTLRNAEPNIGQLITHIEPIGASMAQRAANAADQSQVRRVLEQLTRETGIMCQPHEIMLRRAGGELQLAFHCLMEPGTPITEAHKMTERVESLLRQEVPDLGRVLIHLEPREGNGA
jgi:divalent metal cation (Fe/Co/Zn/Cd) transporter